MGVDARENRQLQKKKQIPYGNDKPEKQKITAEASATIFPLRVAQLGAKNATKRGHFDIVPVRRPMSENPDMGYPILWRGREAAGLSTEFRSGRDYKVVEDPGGKNEKPGWEPGFRLSDWFDG